MTRIEVPYTHRLDDTLHALSHGGVLLASTRASGQSNVMTIGWATIGVIWGLPILVVMVRPSRYTFQFVEASGLFSGGSRRGRHRRSVMNLTASFT